MRVLIDIDGTIADTPKLGNSWDYKNAKPRYHYIKKINKMHDNGDEIIYWTARGSSSGIDWEDFTFKQLVKWGCRFNGLICGSEKGHFDLIIDDKAKRIEEI
tara:strand:+ start:282 stop:587 length:306 start_codon:yes stop_codon:yes gene_type:complete